MLTMSNRSNIADLHILYSLAMSIAPDTSQDVLIRDFCNKTMRAFGCFGIFLWQNDSVPGGEPARLLHSAPRNLPNTTEGAYILSEVGEISSQDAGRKNPIVLESQTIAGVLRWYLYRVPGIGMLGLGKYDDALAESMQHSLVPIVGRFADAIHVRIQRAEMEKERQRMMLATRSASTGIWEWDIESGNVQLDPLAATMCGYSPDTRTVDQQVLLATFEPSDIASLRSALLTAVRTGDLFRAVVRRALPGGEHRYLLVYSRLLANQPQQQRMLGVVLDVTEQRTTQLQIERNEALMRNVFGCMEDLVLVLDADHRIEPSIYGATKLLSVDLQQIVGKRITELPPLQDLDVDLSGLVMNARRERTVQYARFTIQDSDETNRHFQVYVAPLASAAGSNTSSICVFRDITAETESYLEVMRFKQLFDTMPLGAAMSNWNHVITYANDAFAQAHGYAKAEELLGMHIRCLHAAEDSETIEELLERLEREGALDAIEVNHIDRNGTRFPMLQTAVTLRDNAGLPLGFATTAMDIRERKELEQRESYAQRMELIGKLAGAIAHEFNNHLTSIQLHAELIEDRGNAPAGYIGEILIAASRCTSLASQMLGFAKLETRQPERLNLASELERFTSFLKDVLAESTAVTVNASEEELPIWMDRVQMEQIIVNICLNAQESSSNPVTIQIDAWRSPKVPDSRPGEDSLDLPAANDEDTIHLRVHDNGNGMDETVLQSAFEPFYTTKAKWGARGMGLAFVRGVVDQNGGRIELRSAPGQGTTVLIALPACVAALEEVQHG